VSSNNRGLGRGFDALIPTQIDVEFDPTAELVKTPEGTDKRVAADEVMQLDVTIISPNPHQPRTTFDEGALAELAASIKEHGVMQPIVVVESKGDYQLVAGERRLRASKLAGKTTIPAIVRSYSKQQQVELALIENIQREDLNPLETATSYRKLVEEFNMSNDDIAKRVGKDTSTVSNTMRLLNLPLDAKRAVAEGVISEGHGRVILSVKENDKQLELLDLIVKNGWTVRQAEAFARDFKRKTSTIDKVAAKQAKHNDVTEALSTRLKTPVSIQRTAKGGKLLIQFATDKELERLKKAIIGE
jgi:ParB family chromosome partitioning protein